VKLLGTNENAVNADRIVKFIDENELNYIWTIRCDNSETVRDRMSVVRLTHRYTAL